MIRLAKVLAVYLLVGAGVWYAVDPIRRLFVLPALFTTATRGLLLAFLPFALAAAWRYPSMGQRGGDEERQD